MAQLDFVINTSDAQHIAQSDPFTPLPTDWYPAEVVEADFQPMRNGNGKEVTVTLRIVDGQHKGRQVWDRLRIRHVNAEYAQRETNRLTLLSAAALGPGRQLADTGQLVGRVVSAHVKYKKGKDGYEDSNEVAGYAPMAGASQLPPVQPGLSAPPPQPAQPSPAAAPPWAGQR